MAADVVLQADRDLQEAALLLKHFPDVPVVGLVSPEVQSALSRNPSPNIASFVVWPFGAAELAKAISHAVHHFHGGIHENLVAFLPGKAGSGASTVVLNTALVVAQEKMGRVLAIEGDLHSGLFSSMLQVEPKVSIREVLAQAIRPW